MRALHALGRPIRIGVSYGYSRTDRVVIGEAVNITKSGKVTLRPSIARDYMYGNLTERTWGNKAETISIHAHLVFPIADEWIEVGKVPPSFTEDDVIEIQSRDGRKCKVTHELWMLSGWIHNGGLHDIVKFRYL